MTAIVQTLLAKILVLAINLATGIITARALGAQGRGEQAAILLCPQFLSSLLTLGLPSALIYNLKRYPEEKSQLFSAALLMGLGLGLVATLTGIGFLPYGLSQYSLEIVRAAQGFMLLAPLMLMLVILISALEAQGEFTIANQSRYILPLLTLLGLGGLALTQQLTPITAGLSYLLPTIPIFFWVLMELRTHFEFRWRGLNLAYKRLFGYGLRSYGVDLLGTLSLQMDQALVVGLLTPTAMGIYTVALSVSRMINVFQSSVITVLLPKTAARPTGEVVALTGRAARISLLLSLAVAAMAMSLTPFLLPWLYGPEFSNAELVLRILLVEVTLNGTAWVLLQTFMAVGRPGFVTLLQAVSVGLSVTLLLALIPAYGLEGAGLALLASTLLRSVFVLLSYPLILKVKSPNLLINRGDWRYLQQKLLRK